MIWRWDRRIFAQGGACGAAVSGLAHAGTNSSRSLGGEAHGTKGLVGDHREKSSLLKACKSVPR